jgi:hypothetical protein
MTIDAGKFIDQTLDAANTIGEKVNNSGIFDRTDFHNPLDQLENKRNKIDKDYESWQAAAINSAYSALGLEPSNQEKMDELTGAQRSYAAGETKSAEDLAAQQENSRLQQLRAQFDNTVASETKSDIQRQREAINQNYAEALQTANQIENGRTFQSQGFKSQADANTYAQHLREAAAAIHTAEGNKAELARAGELASGQGRLDVLKQTAAGDTTGAARTALENQLDSEQLAIDPNDKERLQQFGKVRDQALANFDADAARQDKFQATQSNERILALREKAKDAELRGDGKSDEAKISDLNFQTEQRVRLLQEQADAAGDSKTKTGFQQEAAAAADAGKRERDALQKELQRTNGQAPALAGVTGQSGAGAKGLDGAAAGNLAEVSKKLEDAATKLEKAISNLKTLTVLKD